MTTRHATTVAATATPPRPIAIGQLGLLLPFVLVVTFIVASGRAMKDLSLGELEGHWQVAKSGQETS